MAPWEIWTYDFPSEGPHPCVLFSNSVRLAHPDFDRVNVLLCRTLRGALQRELKPTETLRQRRRIGLGDGLPCGRIALCPQIRAAGPTRKRLHGTTQTDLPTNDAGFSVRVLI